MNKKTLVAGLIGLVVGSAVIPYNGWLLGAIIGGLLGQLLHIGERLKIVETQLDLIKRRAPTTKIKTPENLRDEARESSGVSSAERPAEMVPTPPRPEPVEPTVENPQRAADTASASNIPPKSAAAAKSPDHAVTKTPGRAGIFGNGIFDKVLDRVRSFFLEGNPVVRVGMVVMLFGLGFLVKYAASAGFFPIHLRLAIIALISMALLIIGWRTRDKDNGYGLVLQGGGIGALYLTVFAASKFYLIFPSSLAFVLMLLIVVFGGILAVLQNAQILALMATAGGFLAPILTSDGSGNHVMLFAFYLLLNLGVLGVALFKAWRWLNWLGFVFTFGISSAWGVLSYDPQFYSSTQPFLIAFFVLYLIVSILFSIKQPVERRGLVDGSLIFGLPVVGFGLQAALLYDSDYGLAISAVILAAMYLVLAGGLWKRYAAAQRLLVEAFIALGVGFATIAIPLALDADWTSATWALEAVGLLWVGLRQQRLLPRISGYGLYLAAAFCIFINGSFHSGATPIVTGDFIGYAILAFGAFGIAYVLHCYRQFASRLELLMQWLPVSAGLLWWLLAGLNEIHAHIYEEYFVAAVLTFTGISLAVLNVVAGRVQWPVLMRTGYSLLPLVILILFPQLVKWVFDGAHWHPLANFSLPALMIVAATQYRFLWRYGQANNSSLLRSWHVITAWLWMVLVFWEVAYWQNELYWTDTTAAVAWFAGFVLPLVVLMSVADKMCWPFRDYRNLYKTVVPTPVLLLLLFWFVVACRYGGLTLYMHLPVLNPLDLAQLAVIVVLAYSVRKKIAGLDQAEPLLRYGGLALLSFIWINVVVMRAVHHYTFVPYYSEALWESSTVQMALSIVWTLCALGVMLGSRRWQSRPLWMAGAGLLALVVIKLFTKDLNDSGTLARVISFLAVGALMLVIGYLSPLPASSSKSLAEEKAS